MRIKIRALPGEPVEDELEDSASSQEKTIEHWYEGSMGQKTEEVTERPAVRIAVCVCTFRRPYGLTSLLEGLRDQRFERTPPPIMLILVADNEGSAQAREICATFHHEHGLPVRYLVEERRGISFARNRCLENVPADFDFVAMIDDDERPEPDWLEELLLAQLATGADVVQGRVYPAFPDDTQSWIRRGGFFGYPRPPSPFRRRAWTDGQDLDSSATNNVLIHVTAINALALRFDERMALTGGEDAVFSRTLKAAGYRIVYGAGARVCEQVPRTRANLAYLCRRDFRDGNNRLWAKRLVKPSGNVRPWRIHLPLAVRALTQTLSAVLWLLTSILRGRTDKALLAHGLMQIANAAGTLVACVGLRYKHYRCA